MPHTEADPVSRGEATSGCGVAEEVAESDHRHTSTGDGAPEASSDSEARIVGPAARGAAMRYHEVGARLGEAPSDVGRAGAAGDAKPGRPGIAEERDLALDTKIEAGEKRPELTIEDGNTRQIDDTRHASGTEGGMEIADDAERVDAEQPSIDYARTGVRLRQHIQQGSVGIVPGQGPNPEGDSRVSS